MKKQIKLYFCPKCKSGNVKHPFGFGNLFGLLPKWRCIKCGYESFAFPQAVFDADKLDKMIKKENKSKAVIICPRCKSGNVKPNMRIRGDNNHLCCDCDYQGNNFLEKINKKGKKNGNK